MRWLAALGLLSLFLVSCSAAERIAESQLPGDVERFTDENGSEQTRLVGWEDELEIEFDRSLLEGVPTLADAVAIEADLAMGYVRFVSTEVRDVDAAAGELEALLVADGWAVARQVQEAEGERPRFVTVHFGKNDRFGRIGMTLDPTFGTVTYNVFWDEDRSLVLLAPFPIPDPDGLVSRSDSSSGVFLEVEGSGPESVARDYAALLEAAGWTIDDVAPVNDFGNAWIVSMTGGGQPWSAEVFGQRLEPPPPGPSDSRTVIPSPTFGQITINVMQG